MTTGDDRGPVGHGPEESTSDPESAGSRSEGVSRSETQDAWKQVTSEFSELGSRLGTFLAQSDTDTKNQTTEAISDLVAAAQRAANNVGAAWTDDEVRSKAKSAFSCLVDAVGASLRDITAADTQPTGSDDEE